MVHFKAELFAAAGSGKYRRRGKSLHATPGSFALNRKAEVLAVHSGRHLPYPFFTFSHLCTRQWCCYLSQCEQFPNPTWTAVFPGMWTFVLKLGQSQAMPGHPASSILCIEPSRSRWASHSSPEGSQCLPCCLLYTQELWCGEGLWYERVTGMRKGGLVLASRTGLQATKDEDA